MCDIVKTVQNLDVKVMVKPTDEWELRFLEIKLHINICITVINLSVFAVIVSHTICFGWTVIVMIYFHSSRPDVHGTVKLEIPI